MGKYTETFLKENRTIQTEFSTLKLRDLRFYFLETLKKMLTAKSYVIS